MNAPLISLIVGLELLAAPDTPDRPLVQARINDQPVRLTIDTCAGRLVVFTHAADRIGLKYDLPRGGLDPNRARPGRTILFRSRSCRLEIDEPNRPALRLQDVEGRRPLWLAALPPGLRLAGVDGVIGWPNVSNCILHLDSGQGIFESLPHLPTWMPPWQRLKLHAPWGLHVLALEVSSPSRAQKAVYIDTGDPGGVKVSSDLWREIVAQQPDVPVALEGYYTPALGCILQRITWLKRLQLGEIELHEVPVSELPAATQQGLSSCRAAIGLYGLTRLELIVDRPHGRAYVRPRDSGPRPYDYNRAGVVFLPVDDRSADLVATVLAGGPAQQAGLRDGDRLLRVNGRDVTGWRTDPNGVPEGRSCFAQPAGTTLTLTVERDDQPIEATITLKELLPIPEPAPAPVPDQAPPLLPDKPEKTTAGLN